MSSKTSASPAPLRRSSSGLVVTKIETILEDVLRQLQQHQPASIPFAVKRKDSVRFETVNFPGKGYREAKKFTRIVLILQLSHDSLVSGIVLTKRNIFYQHRQLFDSQSQVDDLVDAVALSLGVSRDELNIVATSKGLVCGASSVRLENSALIDLSTGESGSAIPIHNNIDHIELSSVRWVLVVEKDAVFRTLVSNRYWKHAAHGPGLLITAKGYPDLNTREFLCLIHSKSPHLPMFVLADCDTDGLNIVRCYRYSADPGSGTVTVNPAIHWLGIKTTQLLAVAESCEQCVFRDSLPPTPSSSSNGQMSISSTDSREPITHLTERDRKVAIKVLTSLEAVAIEDTEAASLKSELQSLLMLGVKSEIQWLDDSGDISTWLDRELQRA